MRRNGLYIAEDISLSMIATTTAIITVRDTNEEGASYLARQAARDGRLRSLIRNRSLCEELTERLGAVIKPGNGRVPQLKPGDELLIPQPSGWRYVRVWAGMDL